MVQQETKESNKQQLEIQRIYVKDLSLESPAAPKIFREEWRPELTIDLNIKNNQLEENVYEVVLEITITAKMGEKTAFLAEVHQAGIFFLTGFDKNQTDQILNAYCPTVLFPYAREVVSDMTVKASFPPLNLAPVNFDVLYLQQQAEGKIAETQSEEEVKH
ncbi:MAG: protein-export chaperone SecB [Gammaproteobacteria bacterium]|jgi:preprotein translocase subunit SecB